MNLEELASLIDKSNIDLLRNEIDSKNSALFETFKNGNSLFHHLVKSSLNETTKIKIVFILSDAGIEINLQNYKEQTALHLAVINGLPEVVNCLLQNGSDLTLVDQADYCAYNHARKLEDKELSRKIVKIMQSYFPTYWIGIDNKDMNIVRRLVNSWCKFKVKRKGKLLIDYAREKQFQPAVDLFKQLEVQMDLCFAVLACNINKVEHIIKNNYSSLIINFKNMKEKGGSIMLYAIKQKDYKLLETILQLKPNILNEYISDELDIDYPIYFAALKDKITEDCLKLLTPEISTSNKDLNISNIFYKGMSVLRYAIEIDYDHEMLFNILSDKYCSKELLTIRDPQHLTCREYAMQCGKDNYIELIDKLTVDYIIKSKHLRMQLALNGFDFFDNGNLKMDGMDLMEWAIKNEDKELIAFLENFKSYQKNIHNFHRAVEKNDYNNVKGLYKVEMNIKGFKTEEIFFENIIESRRNEESQTVFHKAVLNGYYEILSLLLDISVENMSKRISTKMDQIKDHCYRTPYHYAMGIEKNNRTVQLLSQFGFSTNVFDKDGMTPLDFQERMLSVELQELIRIHKHQEFDNMEEPNPWSWSVWTRIQREKDNLKQMISVSHPSLNQMLTTNPHANHANGHSHDHSHGHSHFAPITQSNIEPKLPLSTSETDINALQNGYYSNCILL